MRAKRSLSEYQFKKLTDFWFTLATIAFGLLITKTLVADEFRIDLPTVLLLILMGVVMLICMQIGLYYASHVKNANL